MIFIVPAMNTAGRGAAEKTGLWSRLRGRHCRMIRGCYTCGKHFGATILQRFSNPAVRMSFRVNGGSKYLRHGQQKKIFFCTFWKLAIKEQRARSKLNLWTADRKSTRL